MKSVACLVLAGQALGQFVALENVPQDVTSIRCDVDHECLPQAPALEFTVEPALKVTVEVNPANLVTAYNDNGVLRFKWNREVAISSIGSGIKVGIPENQLRQVVSAGVSAAQVLNGFTHIEGIKAYGDSSVTANLTKLTTKPEAESTGTSSLTIISDSPFSEAFATGDSSLSIIAPSIEKANTAIDADLTVKGNVGDFSFLGDSSVTIEGSITGNGVMQSASTLSVGPVTGQITATGANSISAETCTNVATSESASCEPGTTPTTNIEIFTQDGYAEGTSTCENGGDDFNAASSIGVTTVLLGSAAMMALMA